jgi:hypothetical protein
VKERESGIVASICDYLALRRHLFGVRTIYPHSTAKRTARCRCAAFGAVVCSWSLLIRWAQRARYQAETPLIAMFRFPSSALTMKGLPDIIVIKPGGLFVGQEVKTDIGKLSNDQKLFGNEVHDVGTECYVVRSIDDVVRVGL